MSKTRGALIVFEGCDRSGKTTQCKKLVEYLNSNKTPAKFIQFPARDTQIGKLIDSYLSSKQDLDDHVIHLLFTANRWEARKNMTELLRNGTTLIVDRYAYSGIAFSSAKGLSTQWCKSPEIGLLKPDLVLLLTMTEEAIAKRSGYGQERYEIPEMQRKVMTYFKNISKTDNSKWVEVDADKSIDELHSHLQGLANDTIAQVKYTDISSLWSEEVVDNI